MQTNALKLAEQKSATGQQEQLSWGVVEIQVTDLTRAVGFWTAALGFFVLEQDEKKAVLGTQEKTFFVLHAGATAPVQVQHTGMYHVAIGVPSQEEFSRMMARFQALGIRQSPTDHLMCKSIYIEDPDGLEIEITLETPERFGRFGDMSRGIELFDIHDQPHNGRSALDVAAELAHAQNADLEAPMPNDAFMAHIHFKVGNLEESAQWFEQLGFARNLFLPHVGFSDLGAGADCTHRVAINTWMGPNLTPAPDNSARLMSYELFVHDENVMKEAESALSTSDAGLTGVDPSGTQMTLIADY